MYHAGEFTLGGFSGFRPARSAQPEELNICALYLESLGLAFFQYLVSVFVGGRALTPRS